MKQKFQYVIELRLFDDRIIFNKLLTTNVGQFISCASLFNGKFDSGCIL